MNLKLYSQANDQKTDLIEIKKSILESINESQNQLLRSITEKLDLSEQKISSQIKNIVNDAQNFKAKQAFIEIDKQKLTSANVSNLENYARELHKIYKFHEIDFDLNSALEYIRNGGYKDLTYQGSNANIKYV